MPALTNSRLGSWCTSGALGTTVWPRLPKYESQRRLISAVSMRQSLVESGPGRRRVSPAGDGRSGQVGAGPAQRLTGARLAPGELDANARSPGPGPPCVPLGPRSIRPSVVGAELAPSGQP